MIKLLALLLGAYIVAVRTDVVSKCVELEQSGDNSIEAQQLKFLCDLYDSSTMLQHLSEMVHDGIEGLLDVNDVEPDQAMAKRKHEYLRFGKRKHEYLRFGKRKHEYLRFGKRKHEYLRFGKK